MYAGPDRAGADDRGVLDGRCLGYPGIGDEDIEAITDDPANLLGERMRAIWGGEVSSDRIGAAAGVADFRHHSLCLLCAAAIMNEDLCSGFGERQCAGAARCRATPR